MVKQRGWPTPSWPTYLDGETEGLAHSIMALRFSWGNRGAGPLLHGPQGLVGETEGLAHSFMAHILRWGNRGAGPLLHGPQI